MNAWQIIDWINSKIEEHGWMPKDAAKNLKVSVSCVRYMKHKQGMLRLDSLVMILDTLGYKLEIVRKEDA